MENKQKIKTNTEEPGKLNRQRVDNDKKPGEESGNAEQVKRENLKGKKVDRDIESIADEPLGTADM